MAIPPPAPSAPMPDGGDDSDMTPGADDTGAQGDDDSQDGPTVLLTVMDNHDGSYTVMEGDENDGSSPDSGAADGMVPGAAAPDGGAGAAPQGQTCNSLGEMLKAVMTIAKDAEGGNGAQANFTAGFDGGSAASPAKSPPPPQKY